MNKCDYIANQDTCPSQSPMDQWAEILVSKNDTGFDGPYNPYNRFIVLPKIIFSENNQRH